MAPLVRLIVLLLPSLGRSFKSTSMMSELPAGKHIKYTECIVQKLPVLDASR